MHQEMSKEMHGLLEKKKKKKGEGPKLKILNRILGENEAKMVELRTKSNSDRIA